MSVSAGGGSVCVCLDGRTWVRNECGTEKWWDGTTAAALSGDGRLLATLEEGGATLAIKELGTDHTEIRRRLRRPGRKVRMCEESGQWLAVVADREGGGFAFPAQTDGEGRQIAGHLAALLAIAVSDGRAFTCDRDEKIRISRFPQAHDVLSFCLGHAEFVNGLELVPHDPRCVISCSGDGTVRIWESDTGREIVSVPVCDRADRDSVDAFRSEMKRRELIVENLPVKNIACAKIDKDSSVLIVSLYGSQSLYLYTLTGVCPDVVCDFREELELDSRPLDVAADGEQLWIRTGVKGTALQKWRLPRIGTAERIQTLSIERKLSTPAESTNDTYDEISFLYKRRVDNVQEYHKRKRKRLETK